MHKTLTNPVQSTSDPRWPETREALINAGTSACVIWDFDGVIADSEPVHALAFRTMLEDMGNTVEDGFFNRCIGNHETKIWQMLAEDGHRVDGRVDDLIAARRHVYLDLAKQHLQPSWVATVLPPLFSEVAQSQTVISAGDPFTNQTLWKMWGLDDHMDYAGGGASKQTVLDATWGIGRSMTIEDNPGYLAKAGAAGSFTVRIVHSMSDMSDTGADVTLSI